MFGKFIVITFLLLGVFITEKYSGSHAIYDSNSKVDSVNTARAINDDTTRVNVDSGGGQGYPYGGCGYNIFRCYGK